MPKKYKKEKLIAELHRFYNENGRVPTQLDMQGKFGYPSADAYKRYFRTWNNALETAEFEPNQTQSFRTIKTGLETCVKCGCTREQTSQWLTKGLPKGQVICARCYKNPNYKNGNLNKNSTTGKATISQRVVANVLKLSLKNDCNCSDNFGHPFDLYDKGRYNYINVKDSKLKNRKNHSPHWYFTLNQKELPDTYVMLAYDEDRKNIVEVWITDAVDDLVFDEKKEQHKKFLTITDIPKARLKAKPWNVNAKPYNDMLHKMSDKRKETNGEECFLSNDDLGK